MSLSIAITVILSFASASTRGVIAVLDRKLYSVLKSDIVNINQYNNVLACLATCLMSLLVSGGGAYLESLSDPNAIAFAMLAQLTAYSFAFAYKKMRVVTVVVTSKVSDLVIPITVFLFSSQFELADTAFAVANFLVCLPLIIGKNRDSIHLLGVLAVVSVLGIQGGLSVVLVRPSATDIEAAMLFTGAVVFWRLAVSFLVFLASNGRKTFRMLKPRLTINETRTILSRSLLTVLAQFFMIFALGFGKPVVAWPILNSVGIFAAVFSGIYLKESATRGEFIMLVALVVLGIFRSVL